MSMSSVFVVTNALRLRLFKPKQTPTATVTECEDTCPVSVQEQQELPSAEAELPEIVIGVNGMMCSHCTASVEKACLSVPGTVKAVADLDKKNVTVTGTADYEALKQAILAEDYEVVEEAAEKVLVISVNGMMCSHCTASVEKACMSVPGTVKAVADLEKKQVTVTGTAAYEELKKAIIAEDYEVVEG